MQSRCDGVIEVEPAVPLNGKVVNAKGAGGARNFLDFVPTAVSAGDGSFTIERAPRRYRALSAQAGGLADSASPGASPAPSALRSFGWHSLYQCAASFVMRNGGRSAAWKSRW